MLTIIVFVNKAHNFFFPDKDGRRDQIAHGAVMPGGSDRIIGRPDGLTTHTCKSTVEAPKSARTKRSKLPSRQEVVIRLSVEARTNGIHAEGPR
jgi:hypothetical protein